MSVKLRKEVGRAELAAETTSTKRYRRVKMKLECMFAIDVSWKGLK
jgi:hypothetical protein